ncbi:hypothetical protein GGI25_004276 [Coemansia spiralis]|uniref:Large ribosomal subunit protein mL40 n=2 Tax=Coemansia TaxID=4863 RepID=A0A9W8KX94_9FUNG|nr:mitochondrial ribosomal protein L28-domain-containing protein [Coemansia spiralis]KAJ1990480.1 hypothetical protein EDC05_004020 [Coemansia umbellata]KAJ2620786.1 hypothetical protein GGI26_004681 [Coemansia sp. RSA 1358]KAJ2674624.1 hypothetical protein GGI25_004276 [Coemansia spiralis]
MSAFGRRLCLSTKGTASMLGRGASAAKTSRKAAAASRGPGHTNSDPRYEQMKRILFEEEPRQLPELTAEDVERHETILRAEKIYYMQKSAQRRQERERRFGAMEKAYVALEKLDSRLFEAACKKEPNVTFPRQMRVPTETPPRVIWDYSNGKK